MPPNQRIDPLLVVADDEDNSPLLRCAVLGCGMMGREHVSYLQGYQKQVRIDFLCDPHPPSLDQALKIWHEYSSTDQKPPTLLATEDDLLQHCECIDLLVIAHPNYMHTDTLLRWAPYEHITILLEKPVAVSVEQHDRLLAASIRARVWVAMEYRYIPAIAKLIELLPTIGKVQMCTIRENRFPFLHKIEAWNRDRNKTGDTLVEKCCHFFDLMRLITKQEAETHTIRAMVQRGLNYEEEPDLYDTPIIDSAYVFTSFVSCESSESETSSNSKKRVTTKTMGCLELCMFADGSRHQEEVIVTGTKGRLEAYLPENKVYAYQRPSKEEWSDRSLPPPHVNQIVHDCSDVKSVHGIDTAMPTHGGFHYSSTGVEWFKLLQAIRHYELTGDWKPDVSLTDGLRAVEIGLRAQDAIVNET